MSEPNIDIPFRPGQTIGIDLGTTFSSVSQLNSSGVPIPVKNHEGQVTTPSIVLLGDNGQVTVGPSPERIAQADPRWVVQSIKREMGGSRFSLNYMGRQLNAEFISALVLKKLKLDAEKQLGPVGNAVITVPYYFNDLCRRATQNAGQIAGLNVVDIINEPTAATLTYAWLKGELGRGEAAEKEKTIMVYDLGGGTFDVTVVQYTPTHFRVIATDGDVRLGGLDWTDRIVQHVSDIFVKRDRYDPRQDPHHKLVFEQRCERAKRALSTQPQVMVDLPLPGGRLLSASITRAEFETMTADLIQRTRDTTELVLEQARIDPATLDEILLVGGSTHMPIVSWMLRSVTGKIPSRDLNPDLAVAQGAAIHAAILEARSSGDQTSMAHPVLKRLRGIRATDVNSHSLGIVVTDPINPQHQLNHIMIRRNSSIPRRVTQRFVTTLSNPSSITLQLLEGESPEIEACTTIAEFRIVGLPPNLPAGSPVELTYSYDRRGRIHATARELHSNCVGTLELVHSTGLTDAGLAAFVRLAADYRVE
ncbi:MAG: Hsp70 family protein [Planctomycetota bacterium]